MTNEDKQNGIIERLKSENTEFDPMMLSALVITQYLSDFQELGILEGSVKIEESGKKVIDVINEFNWLPSDNDIESFVNGLVSFKDINGLIRMLKIYRDNPIEFVEKYKSKNE